MRQVKKGTNMNEQSPKLNILLAWCESCSEPVYNNIAHKTVISEKGNTYVYCNQCDIKATTPDVVEEE